MGRAEIATYSPLPACIATGLGLLIWSLNYCLAWIYRLGYLVAKLVLT
jgi:hypothetical protein